MKRENEDTVTGQPLVIRRTGVRNCSPSVGKSEELGLIGQVGRKGPTDEVDGGPDWNNEFIEFRIGEYLDVPFLLDADKLKGEVPDVSRAYVRMNMIGGGQVRSRVLGEDVRASSSVHESAYPHAH